MPVCKRAAPTQARYCKQLQAPALRTHPQRLHYRLPPSLQPTVHLLQPLQYALAAPHYLQLPLSPLQLRNAGA